MFMRRIISFLVPVVAVAFAVQAEAQHSGGHIGAISPSHAGGFSEPHFSGGFSSPAIQAPRSFAPPAASSFRNFRSAPGVGLGTTGSRPGLNSFSRYAGGNHRPYQKPGYPADHENRYRYGYGSSFYAYGTQLVPNFVGYPFGFDAFDDSNYDQGDQAYAQDGGASQPQYPQDSQSMSESGNGVYPSLPPPDVADNQGPVGPIYRPEYHNDSSGAVHAQPATTLVFNDGRPNMQVHNYVLTSTVLYNLDGDTETEIPLSEINLQATEQANRSAGVDFSLPSGN